VGTRTTTSWVSSRSDRESARGVGCAVPEKPGAPSDTAGSYPQPPTEAGTETEWDGLMGRTTLTRQGTAPVMTNDTIDHDARVAQAAVVRLPRHAAVRADLDAAGTQIMRTLYLRAHSRVAEGRAIPRRNDRRQAIPTLRGGKHPPLDCPTSTVPAGGEGMYRLLSVNEAAEVLGTSVTRREAGQWRGC